MARMNKIFFSLVLGLIIIGERQVFAVETQIDDVRILIDVSGSMKKNDPDNLRRPALDLVIELLPDKSTAGVWTFAKYVNMLVPHQSVTSSWREKAKKQTKKIHSAGLFTDIEQVLQQATVNPKSRRHRNSVILLSDGLVDISPDDTLSAASKKRIIEQVIPRLKQANVAVHTIALSSGSDKTLLRDIALSTGGWYEQVDDAASLQRTFLHLFEKSAKRDTVPIAEENQFMIDASVTEMTILVFRQAGSPATLLQTPSGQQIDAKTIDENIRWLNDESGYDLITINQPAVGEWTIQAQFDPDNRVMVLTDLQLQTSQLPNNIVSGEYFDFDIQLTNNDQLIDRPAFLSLVDVSVAQETNNKLVFEENINNSLQQGIYRTQLGDHLQAGRNDIITTVISGTFERQHRQTINVVTMPFTTEVDTLENEPTRTHRIRLTPDRALINSDKTAITALLIADDGSEWPYELLRTPEDKWQLTIADLEREKNYELYLQVNSETITGRQLFIQPDAIPLIENTESNGGINSSNLTNEAEPADMNDDEASEFIMEEDVSQEIYSVEDELGVDEDALETLLESEDSMSFDAKEEPTATIVETLLDDTSTMIMMIGNMFFVFIAAMIFFLMRRKTAVQIPDLEQL